MCIRDSLTALASALVARRQKAIAVIQRFAAAAEGGVATRVHGDLHLGQILVTGSEVKFIDFEGEPAKPLEIRRAKASPLRDVAGMVRSFDYAAATAAIAASTVAEGVEARGAEMVAQFREVATRRFLAAYDEVAGGYSPELLDLFLIEKAAYEITYEAANRPAWIGTPMRGLAEILDRLLGA